MFPRLAVLAALTLPLAAPPVQADTVNLPVAAVLDDTYGASTSNVNNNTADDVRFGRHSSGSVYTGFLRFQVSIPAGSVVTSAKLRLWGLWNLGGAFTSTIRVLTPPANQSDQPEYSIGNYADSTALSSIASTGTAVSYAVPAGWTVGGWNDSPDIGALVQTFISLPAYNPQGSLLGLKLEAGDAPAGVYKGFDSKDRPGGTPAQLVLTFLAPGQFPVVTAVSPAENAVAAPLASTVRVTFSRDMAASVTGKLTLIAILDAEGSPRSSSVPGTAAYDAVSRTLTFTPSIPLSPHVTYEAVMDGSAVDVTGGPLPGTKTWRFTTLADPTRANVMVGPDGTTRVSIPGNAVTGGFGVRISTVVSSPSASAANAKALGPAVVTREITLVDSTGKPFTGTLASPAEITLVYPDADQDGLVDGTNPPVRESTLGAYWLDEASSAWVRLPGSTLDTETNRMRVTTPHFSVFALAPAGASGLNNTYAYPVPFRPARGDTQITFTGLPLRAAIRVYTVSGEEVIQIDETDGDGRAVWDGKNAAGEPVASGLYVYQVEDLTATRPDRLTGHLVVIR